jgi:glycosyltransferase involved in cell wall biosynthesis
MNNELVSVVIPAYNAERYIAETMDSVCNQTYSNLEILIANDGSTDRTLAILKEYQQKDNRIIIDDHENMGISKNINRLSRLAKGEILVRIDADDLMMPMRIEKQVRYLQEHPEVDFVSCDAEFINEKSEIFGYQSFGGFDVPEDSKKILQTQSLVICAQAGFTTRKSAFWAVGGYNEDIIYAEDLDLFTRMVENGSVLIILHEPLIKYRLHANSAVASNKNLLRNQIYLELVQENITRRRNNLPEMTFATYKQQVESQPWTLKFKRKRKAMSSVAYRNAGALIGNKMYLQAAKQFVISFVCNPQPFFKKTIRHLKNFLKG